MKTSWVQDGVAERMKAAAKRAEMSAAQIAEKMGVGKASIYRWWEGERCPSPERVEEYAAAVGVPVSYIYQKIDESQLRKEFAEWMLELARSVQAGERIDQAFDRITGSPEELSLRERRMLRDQNENIRQYLSTLPEDEESRRQILLHLGSTLGRRSALEQE